MSFLQQFPPGIVIEDEGLTQKLSVHYTSEEGRRTLVSPNHTNQHRVVYKRDVCFHLPLFLTPSVWKRYGFSLADIKTTIVWNQTEHLYQLGLLHGISPSNSAVKIAFSSRTSLVFSSKAIISKKIVQQLEQRFAEKLAHRLCYFYRFPEESCLDTVRQDHVPALPLVVVSLEVFEYWCKQIPDDFREIDGGHWKEAWTFKDIQMVPFWIEKGALLMTRIIAKSVFDASGRISDSLATKPIRVTIGRKQKEYCGVEEACFLVPNRASELDNSVRLS